jgi:hypothetical protein
MPRFRAEVVLYFEAEDMRAVPRRLHELNAAAEAVGFNFHGAKIEEGSEPEPGDDGWTGYAPLPEHRPVVAPREDGVLDRPAAEE